MPSLPLDFVFASQVLPWIIGVVGLAMGSFITAISYRMPRELPWMAVRSICPSSKKPLSARDLIPVLSWVIQRGKSRHSGEKIGLRYPLIELCTAGALVGLYYLLGEKMTLNYGLMAGLVLCVITLTVTDLEHYMIPDEVQIAIGVLGIAHGLFVSHIGLDVMLKGAALGFAIGAALHYGYFFLKGQHGLGFGDVKLMAVAGLWLGPKLVIPFLFYGGLFGVVSAVIWRSLKRGCHFPFGPALAYALLLILLYSPVVSLFWEWPFLLFKLER